MVIISCWTYAANLGVRRRSFPTAAWSREWDACFQALFPRPRRSARPFDFGWKWTAGFIIVEFLMSTSRTIITFVCTCWYVCVTEGHQLLVSASSSWVVFLNTKQSKKRKNEPLVSGMLKTGWQFLKRLCVFTEKGGKTFRKRRWKVTVNTGLTDRKQNTFYSYPRQDLNKHFNKLASNFFKIK